MSALATIAERLRARIGLDPSALGHGALAHAVRGRSRALQLGGTPAYLAALERDPGEWDALVEAVAVPETWFFRDRAPFALLSQRATRDWAGRGAADPIAVLSLPCASGEEAWSIAIALAAAGVPPQAFRVDAVDLSERALRIARAGVYPARSLRGHRLDPAWAAHLPRQADGTLTVEHSLRHSVRFRRGNLLEVARTFSARRFDCICSRNLLIYCDDATRAAAIADFAALLKPEGLLILGHAETLPTGTQGFVREGPPGAFAWRKATPSPLAGEGRDGGRVRRPTSRSRPAVRRHPPHPHLPPRGGKELETARHLADRGKLTEAATVIEMRIASAPTDAGAHALLGIVCAAQNRDDAALQHLRRALYLDPTHEDALVHLALIMDRRGDADGAARLRARARKVAG